MARLSHFDAKGAAHMVDVGGKPESRRLARARVLVTMSPATLDLVRQGTAAKGDVLGTARLAGIMAAKRTADLVPLCHPLPLTSVSVDFGFTAEGVDITTSAETLGRTGVEMEAMTAAAVAALTIYDMVKSAERGVTITGLRLVLKEGGKSGRWTAPQ
jgi:cyclic pyranopterin phosphate synthase